MTNEEAIKKDKKYLFDRMMDLIKDEFDERDESYNIGVGECIDILTECSFNNLSSVFQENTKLKTENERIKNQNNHYFEQYSDAIDEIEQLKENYDTLAKQYSNVENSSIRYYNELKQLKSELEQSVKLPCTCNNCKYADFMGVESEHFYCMNHKHYMNVGGYCSFGEKEEPWQTAERTGVK